MTHSQSSNLEQANESESVDSISEEPSSAKPLPDFLLLAILFEGGLIVLALVIGAFGFRDSSQSLSDFDSVARIQPAVLWAIIATPPMLLLLLGTLKSNLSPFRSLRKTVEEYIFPITGQLSLWKIVVIAVLAGFGEELLFRWCLQGGLTEYFAFEYGPYLAAVLIGILFGICHFITAAYALFATVIGIFLGLVMIWSGTYLAPAFAHTFYDFVALLVIVKQARVKENKEKDQ